ncbi:MAG: L-threonylcarbamoyladenylate synthase [Bacteroidota bacterium]
MQAEIGKDISRAAALLRAGKLVAIPTETVYGLAGNALNEAAVASIFDTKERPSFDPLIIHLPTLDHVAQYVQEIPPLAQRLADQFWPGPLTMVFARQPVVPDLVTAGLDTVAVRIPRHPLTRQLLLELDFPLAAPSANPFGYISPTSAEHVARQLGHKIPYVLDGGHCQVGLESTIVSFTGSEPVILRKGGIALEAIFAALDSKVAVQTHSSSNPQAPGMLAKHYSPQVPFFLVTDLPDHQQLLRYSSIARIVFGATSAPFPMGIPTTTFNLSVQGDFSQAARKLFGLLRQLDDGNFDAIVADLLPERGLGRAINDRLRRAAAR